jgi:hypothetical protein
MNKLIYSTSFLPGSYIFEKDSIVWVKKDQFSYTSIYIIPGIYFFPLGFLMYQNKNKNNNQKYIKKQNKPHKFYYDKKKNNNFINTKINSETSFDKSTDENLDTTLCTKTEKKTDIKPDIQEVIEIISFLINVRDVIRKHNINDLSDLNKILWIHKINKLNNNIHKDFMKFALLSKDGITKNEASKWYGVDVKTPSDIIGLTDIINVRKSRNGFIFSYKNEILSQWLK